ncbi:MAG: TrkA family potassium uptake protein [Chloroflexota bacterium]
MYILVVGGNRISRHLARDLLREGHEVTVIEKDAQSCSQIEEELGEICLQGDGSQVFMLEAAGAERADMLIALTDADEDNLVACQVAKNSFSVRRTIARLGNPQHKALFEKLGVDIPISTSSLILEHVQEEVPTHSLTHLTELEDNEAEIVAVKMLPNASGVGKRVNELSLPPDNLICLLIRKGEPPFIPHEDTLLQADDRLIASTYPETEEALMLALLGDASHQ